MLRGGGMPVVVRDSVGLDGVGSSVVEVGDVDRGSLEESCNKSEVSKFGLGKA